MKPKSKTRELILEIGNELVAERGPAALTFEAIAKRLGTSKQAVIYWFPAKQDLMRALVLPALAAEAQAMAAAVRSARDAGDAAARFVRAYVSYHLRDLRRFRLLYLAAQLNLSSELSHLKRTVVADIPPITRPMYDALQAKFAADQRFPANLDTRQTAVAIHTAALGLVTLVGLAAVVDDPLAHSTDALVETLAAMLGKGTSTAGRRAANSTTPPSTSPRARRAPAKRSRRA
jgi:AcrR family transcriptional regulator